MPILRLYCINRVVEPFGLIWESPEWFRRYPQPKILGNLLKQHFYPFLYLTSNKLTLLILVPLLNFVFAGAGCQAFQSRPSALTRLLSGFLRRKAGRAAWNRRRRTPVLPPAQSRGLALLQGGD